MFSIRRNLTFVFAVIVAAFAQSAVAGDDPVKFRIGNATVWAIADVSGEREMSMFSRYPELVEQYVPSGKAPSAVMTYLVRTDDGLVLIDTGNGRSSGGHPSRLLPGLAEAGFSAGDIATVLITHMHGDHIGGLMRDGKIAFPGARVLIGRVEADFWLGKGSPAKYPHLKGNFDLARQVVDAYGDKVAYFAFGDVVVPGITALDAVGHTPGHSVFMIESDGEKLLCIGDLLNAATLQFPRPDVNADYDMNFDHAMSARQRYLEMAAGENIPIAGMHIPFPGIGRTEKAGEGYVFLPGLP